LWWGREIPRFMAGVEWFKFMRRMVDYAMPGAAV